MTLKSRMQKLEASLHARERFFLWLHDAKAAGGFEIHWEQELRESLLPFEWLMDEEAHTLYLLVNDVNLEVLRTAETKSDLRSLTHCALDGVLRQVSRPNRAGTFVLINPIPELTQRVGGYLCARLRALIDEALSLASAIEEISDVYLDGEDVLFADTRATVNAETANLRKTADIFRPLVAWLNVEPITVEGFGPGHPVVDAKANQFVEFSRAQALIGKSDHRRFMDALHRACPELAHTGPSQAI
jgi:hypothetical protein